MVSPVPWLPTRERSINPKPMHHLAKKTPAPGSLDQLNIRQALHPLQKPIPVPPNLIASNLRVVGTVARNEIVLSVDLEDALSAKPKAGGLGARRREGVRRREADRSGGVGHDVEILIAVWIDMVRLEGEAVGAGEEEGFGIDFLLDSTYPGGIYNMHQHLISYNLNPNPIWERKEHSQPSA